MKSIGLPQAAPATALGLPSKITAGQHRLDAKNTLATTGTRAVHAVFTTAKTDLASVDQSIKNQSKALAQAGTHVAQALGQTANTSGATTQGLQSIQQASDRAFTLAGHRAPAAKANGAAQRASAVTPKISEVITRLKAQGRPDQILKALHHAWGGAEPKGLEPFTAALAAHQASYLQTHGNSAEAKTQWSHELKSALAEQLPPGLKAQYLHTSSQIARGGEEHLKACVRSFVNEKLDAMLPPRSFAPRPLADLKKSAPLALPKMAKPDKLLDTPTALDRLLKTAPPSLRNHPNWANFAQRMDNYLSAMKDFQGSHFKTLLNTPNLDVSGLLSSLKTYSALDPSIAKKMGLERDLVNIGMQQTAELMSPGSNDNVLGCSRSFAQQAANAVVTEPGNQLSLAMDTVIRRQDGQLKKITLLSCAAPALDSAKQPEWSHYVDSSGMLDTARYAFSMDALKGHILQCARDNPNSKRVVLSAIGVAAFLGGLTQAPEQKLLARKIVAQTLGEAAIELKAMGKSVAFTDINKDFCDQVNEYTLGDPELQVLGAIPGNWIENGDMLLNAWDPNSLVGNGLALDQSLDGFIGRNSLAHLQHAMACALHAEGMA
jgi:hypothetical protein